MLRKRIWLNTPWGTYSDKKKHLLSNEEIEQYKMYEENNIAFNYGDFINSTCITSPTVSVLARRPNYMLLVNGTDIEARYFVTNYQYISGEPKNDKAGNYEATLYRDLIIDYKDDIKNNLFKCERGYLDRNTWSPILVQPEGLFLNKIKKEQIPIKIWDDNAQWLTIFYDTGRDANIDLEFDQTNLLTDFKTLDFINNVYTTKGLQAPVYPSDEQIYKRTPNLVAFDFIIAVGTHKSSNTRTGFRARVVITPTYIKMTDYWTNVGGDMSIDVAKNIANDFFTSIQADIFNVANNEYGINKYDAYTEIRNAYDNILVQNNTILTRMDISQSITSVNTDRLINGNAIYDLIAQKLQWGREFNFNNYYLTFLSDDSGVPHANNINMKAQNSVYIMKTTFTETSTNASISLPAQKTSPRLNQTYLGCLTIPFGENVKVKNGDNIYEATSDLIQSLATEGWNETGTLIKDIQILPYCPCNKLNQEYNNDTPNSTIDATFLNDLYKIPIKFTDNIIYYGFICDQSSMNYRYPIDLSSYFSNDIKMDSITKSIRLCSHNHKQSFEMNPTLNNGVDSLSFECTLRPNNTVYHICPIFKELYGGNYEDVRGLVWEGGFSLPFVSNAFTEYRLQNSTYKELFDRDVKNYEINANIARQHETLNYETAYENSQTQLAASNAKGILNTALGVAGTAASGHPIAAAGMAIGSMANMAINNIAQNDIMTRNLQAAKKSQALNDQLRAEGLLYKQDTFNLQMQAVEARPNTVATSTEYSILNYYKAYIEIYDCTEIEKEFINKLLTYHGMKIGQIGYINNYILNDNCYVEGNLIFLGRVDVNIANAINSELKSGIYVQEGLFN